jgi:hypothetical protein
MGGAVVFPLGVSGIEGVSYAARWAKGTNDAPTLSGFRPDLSLDQHDPYSGKQSPVFFGCKKTRL